MYNIYTIQEGDTIENIASRYNVTPYILYQLNGLSPNYDLSVGDNIIVPNNNSSYFDYYTIKKGDSLYKIASKYDVDYNILALINGLELDDYIYPNQVIAVPKNGVRYYVVSDNDTLMDISNKLNVSVNDIINQNNQLYLLPEQLIVYKSN